MPTLTTPLTDQQLLVLNCVERHQRDRNRVPMLYDVMEECGIPTLRSVRYILRALHWKGFVVVDEKCTRIIRLET